MPATFWTGKAVAVTGGAGFLGRHLVQRLLSRGARVRILDQRAGPWPEVETHLGDVRDAAFVHSALQGCDVIFHTAGPVATWGEAVAAMHAVHRDGTRNVLAAAGAARVVHTSSVVAVGAFHTPRPVDEEAAFNLAGVRVPYIQAKHQAEQAAMTAAARGQDVVVVNPAFLFGPDDEGRSVVGRQCQHFWAGRVLAAPPGGLNLVDVRDVAEGCLLAAEHGRAGRRYLLGGEDHAYASFLALLARPAGLRPRWLPTAPWAVVAAYACAGEMRGWLKGREPVLSLGEARMNRWYFYCRSGRARAELGYAPRPLEETAREVYAGHRAQGRRGPHGLARWWLRAA